ncbi:MAG: GGDEF domain-containing protein [Kamptonema sp. SIO4C4]|nr:GGDEF domain-containing protein [Kamptonema sp. SIO4C4]
MLAFGNFTLSIGGTSIIPNLEKPPQILIQTTDEALYQAKQSGRDRYVFQSLELCNH